MALPWIPVIGGLWVIALPIIAIIFGGIGIAKDDSKGMGIAGLVLGIVGIIMYIVVFVLLAIAFSFYMGGMFM
ncbi:MAG: hypothetical protein ACFFG0_22485 [Candidatus Thorarchaeota archaeon]